MNAPRHEMILASAGSGKTHALTNRFVRLLAQGALPERIVALTFTRKAAGEFFDKILEKLAGAAADPVRARQLAVEVGEPRLAPVDFLKLLRGVVEAMPRLNLGTLDGFFARVVRSFPLELGLDGEFQIMDEASARRERRRVLRTLFASHGRPGAAQREFIEAFKRATFGVEEKQLVRVLNGFLDTHAELFLEASLPAQWGDPRRIWPHGCPWLAAAERRALSMEALRAALAIEPLGEKQRARLDSFISALSDWEPGAPLPDAVKYVAKNAFAAGPELSEITLERQKVNLSPPMRAALESVVAGLAGAEILRRLETTRGIFQVLRGYERNYHEAVRRAGRLTFADVLRLLLPEAGGPVLSAAAGSPGNAPARLLIDWRLDGEFDHWLLDEFQDTSFAQWSVLRNLIDEAVQDAEGRRSFFYVGDVKQAIFAWRGGDPRLFREIFDQYNRGAPEAIAEGRLDASWRSGPAVIAMVNRVFGGAVAWQNFIPASAAERWTKEWRAHTTAWRPALAGRAELRRAAGETGRFAETLRVLQEVEPLKRGLAAAVLVRTNDTATALADYLRRHGGLPAIAESDRRVATDNPFTAALLAMLRAAAHPGDTLAQEHLRMTPLAALLADAGISTPGALTVRVLEEIHEEGFAGMLEKWLRKLAPTMTGDPFGVERGRMLVAAAAEFDSGGSRDVAEFLEFAASFTVRDSDAVGNVRVMTIHKAKGLGFDLTILPDLEGTTLAERRGGLAVKKAADRSVEWVLDLPARLFTEQDDTLAAQLAAEEGDTAYENICLLYVAMTRAKRSMYVIIEPGSAKSTSRNFPKLLNDTLGETWAQGDPGWFEKINHPPPDFTPPMPVALLEPGRPARAPRRPAQLPSGFEARTIPAAHIFGLGVESAAEFGRAVHELFAGVDWVDGDSWDKQSSALKTRGPAGEEVLACLQSPALADLWTRKGDAELWRERAFEVVLDGTWITGVCDRVTVERDATGSPRSAAVIDFKTDRVRTEDEIAEAATRHAAQLNLYRRVVALLTGLSPSEVTCELVFTAPRRRELISLA